MVVAVVRFVVLVIDVSSSARSMHIRRIENDAVDGPLIVRKIAAIHVIFQVCREQFELLAVHSLPEYALSISHIGYGGLGRDVQLENLRKNLVVGPFMSAEHKVVCGDAIWRLPI